MRLPPQRWPRRSHGGDSRKPLLEDSACKYVWQFVDHLSRLPGRRRKAEGEGFEPAKLARLQICHALGEGALPRRGESRRHIQMHCAGPENGLRGGVGAALQRISRNQLNCVTGEVIAFHALSPLPTRAKFLHSTCYA
jgi:hypothetical protein